MHPGGVGVLLDPEVGKLCFILSGLRQPAGHHPGLRKMFDALNNGLICNCLHSR